VVDQQQDVYGGRLSDEFERITPSSARPAAERLPTARPAIDWSQTKLDALTISKLEMLITSAEAGDPAALAAFEQFLANDGSAAWREIGDLADVAEKALISKLFGGQKGPALSARRRFQQLRQQLTADHATPLEKLAIDRVILASTFACAVDCLVAAEGAAGLTSEKRIKAQQQAEKRVQTALRSLQTAREISRAASNRPLRLFGRNYTQAAGTPPLSATG
jgi:hypothetical protein